MKAECGDAEPVRIHRAPWVFPAVGPAVADGAVVVCGGRVLESGKAGDILSRYGGVEVRVWDHDGSALIPGGVNAHTHLEFSAIARSKPEAPPGFAQWVLSVFQAKAGQTPAEVLRAREGGRVRCERREPCGSVM